MSNTIIAGKSLSEWITEFSLLESIIETKEVFWTNPLYNGSKSDAPQKIDLTIDMTTELTKDDVKDAADRLERFAPYIAKVFPETRNHNGMIESPLVDIPSLKNKMENVYQTNIPGTWLLKCDNLLPIAGSVKARGGIYEVLKHAEDVAIENQLLSKMDDYASIDSDAFRTLYSQYSISVGSTGNLGLSIGIIGAQLGFKVYVHMSADAKQWKKELLRKKGVTVIEYDADFSEAVKQGRKQADLDPMMHFIDDENSKHLFLGYAVAAYRLMQQLDDRKQVIDADHPLFVYLPCGVGGAPGGITFGLKLVFQENVHCFFAEPTHSPCMLLGLLTGLHDQIAVQDIGIDNITEADGLAVGRPSGFIGRTLEQAISGVYTVTDEQLFILLKEMVDEENIKLEPSATAGLIGPIRLMKNNPLMKNNEGVTSVDYDYIQHNQLRDKMSKSTHISWATGGSMVPKDVMNAYYIRA